MHMHQKNHRFRRPLKHEAHEIAAPRKGMRIVCLSDTHCQTNSIDVPDGDVLIIAGDVCLNGHEHELQGFDEFLWRLPHKHKLFVAGNHDVPFANITSKEAGGVAQKRDLLS